jgi:hypothetical protein
MDKKEQSWIKAQRKKRQARESLRNQFNLKILLFKNYYTEFAKVFKSLYVDTNHNVVGLFASFIVLLAVFWWISLSTSTTSSLTNE